MMLDDSVNIALKPILRAYVAEVAAGIRVRYFQEKPKSVAVKAIKGDLEYGTL
jgi:hypothetical protein